MALGLVFVYQGWCISRVVITWVGVYQEWQQLGLAMTWIVDNLGL